MNRRNLGRELFNLPNAITLTRIVMIPVFLWFTYHESRVDSFIACLVYACTSATDFLDGWIARRKGLVTLIGKFLDPLADKLVVMAALVMLVHLGRVGAWVVILIMAREFIVTGLRTIAIGEGIVIAAGQEGKHKTAFQLAGITFLLLNYTYPVEMLFFSFDLDANKVGTWLLYISLVFSIWSAVVYIRSFVLAAYRGQGTAPGAQGDEAPSPAGEVPSPPLAPRSREADEVPSPPLAPRSGERGRG